MLTINTFCYIYININFHQNIIFHFVNSDTHLLIMGNSDLFLYGTIAKIEIMDKGYTKVLLSVNIPFKRKYMVFNIWDDDKLKDKFGVIKIGDCVSVSYHYKDQFPVMDELIRVHRLDNCPICFSDLDPIDTQRINCSGCSSMDELEYKDRVSENMKLISYSLREYQFSHGFRLEFIAESTEKKFIGVIFKNNILYDKISELNVSETYHVVGWKSKDDFVFRPFEIIEINKAM